MGIFSDILLTVDYDRTLTAPDSSIPERNLEAIRYFMENGGAFTVNTGRSLPMTAVFRDIVPVSAPLLLYNGSAAYDLTRERLTFTHEIQLDMWDTLEKCMEKFPDLNLEVQGIDAHYCIHDLGGWEAFTRAQPCALAFANRETDCGPFMKFTLYGEIRDVTVAHFFEGSPEEIARMDEAQKWLNDTFGDSCEVFRAAPRIIDIHAKGVSKLRSARQLQAQMGKKILVCVGDGHNDVSMMEGADYAYTPSDSVLKGRFEAVCPCGEGAVADVIYKKIPEILGIKP